MIEKEVHGKSVEIIKSSINWKFLGRFSVALMVDTEYTIVLDDDMSPGAKWFENSIRVIGQYNALATGNGRIVRNVDEYNHAALGETSKNDHDILVTKYNEISLYKMHEKVSKCGQNNVFVSKWELRDCILKEQL